MPSESTTDPTDEDDYLTMTFDEPAGNTRETLTQKRRRQAREAEERSRPKSKDQIAREERAKRDAALNTSNLNNTNKGFKMMAALGYTPGTALGKKSETNGEPDKRLLEPIGLDMKEDRSGIGADSEKKRKFLEEVGKHTDTEKRQKVDADDFRIRQQHEKEDKKREAQFYGAMKVAERLEEEDPNADFTESQPSVKSRPLSSYDVLWRGLIKQRLLSERDRRIRHDLDHSLSRLPTYDDPDEEEQDKIVLSRKAQIEEVDLELDQDDPELENFEALEPSQRLQLLVMHLREKWQYCFWCRYRYSDVQMEGCPGLTEEDHD